MSDGTYSEEEVEAIQALASEISAVLDGKELPIIINALADITSKAIYLTASPRDVLRQFTQYVTSYGAEASMEKLRRKYAEEIRKQ